MLRLIYEYGFLALLIILILGLFAWLGALKGAFALLGISVISIGLLWLVNYFDKK